MLLKFQKNRLKVFLDLDLPCFRNVPVTFILVKTDYVFRRIIFICSQLFFSFQGKITKRKTTGLNNFWLTFFQGESQDIFSVAP